MKKHILGFALLTVCLSACKSDLSVLGRDQKGTPIRSWADSSQYEKKLVHSIGSLTDSTLAALEESSTQTKNWELQLIVLGAGLDANVGFGPFKVGVQPGIRAFFTNTPTPPPLP